MAKAVTLGEIMLRLSPTGHLRFSQAHNFDVNFGGGEANVAAALAMFGHETEFVTKLPDNMMAHSAVSYLKSLNVNTKHIVFGGNRIGIYFFENGAANRASGVIYDRAGSAFSEAEISDFDFDNIMCGADLFHISGITPAISDCGAAIAEAALKSAKKNNVTVSFDVNYRSKLWTVEKAREILSNLVGYADICFASAWDASNLLKTDVSETASFDEAARAMSEKYGFEFVAASKREIYSASSNGYYAMIYSADDDTVYSSGKYTVEPIVDRVGTGDAFAAGVLCGLLDGKHYTKALEFGVASAVLKHTVPGDMCCATREETEQLIVGNSVGKIQR